MLRDRIFASRFYRLTLGGRVPSRLLRLPPPPLPGDPDRGRAILTGRLICARHVFDTRSLTLWRTEAPREARAELHGFTWLNDLAVVGSPDAQETARALLESWLAHEPWDDVSWSPAVAGTRLVSWLNHARFLSRGSGDPLGRPILRGLTRQARHLVRTIDHAAPGLDHLIACRGLIYASLCGVAAERLAGGAQLALERSVASQVLADGGHVTRSPTILLHALAVLSDIQAMMAAAGLDVPRWLGDTVARMAAMVAFFRHEDGTLAAFNHSPPAEPVMIAAVLERVKHQPAPPLQAETSGFARLAAGDARLVIDVGVPAPPPYDRGAYAGTLSFEMSHGEDRLIVNCGTAAEAGGEWSQALRATAAHSTAVIDDTNSAEIAADGSLGRRPLAVPATCDTADGGFWVTASHDGYATNFATVHRRRLYLAADGNDLRGEDSFIGRHRGAFAIRFHLHPDVQASLVQNAAAVLLRSRSGTAWRLQAQGGVPSLAESVYMGSPTGPRRCEQIVLSGRLDGSDALVKWAFRRIGVP